MRLVTPTRDPWLAGARDEAAHRSENLVVSAGFDWSQVQSPVESRATFRGRFWGWAHVLPVAVVLVIGLGLALGWALTRKAPKAQPSYLLLEVAEEAGPEVGEAPIRRRTALSPVEPAHERVVRADTRQPRRLRRPVPVSAAEPEAPSVRQGKVQRHTPSVIIVRPPARLPPLFSPKDYRNKH
ncbi:MAG: hypothetical protein JRH20_12575 [Deltaproteobacteria bacterium]|nr:hypothetical protein [Deltaproteobacteria bacterium]